MSSKGIIRHSYTWWRDIWKRAQQRDKWKGAQERALEWSVAVSILLIGRDDSHALNMRIRGQEQYKKECKINKN